MERVKRRSAPQIMAAGDAALLVQLDGRPGPAATRRATALVAALDASPPPGLLDIVPAYTSVLVRFNPHIIEPPGMRAILQSLLTDIGSIPSPHGRLVRVPVCYGNDDGPDLQDVAEYLGLTTQELIQRHTSATYRVAFLGFLAGFPYLTGLPSKLTVPRLTTPRTRVPAGSIAIADRQAGIYPVDSPGGWRILGRTSIPLFDPAHNPPSLLRPGDRVRFYPATSRERVFTATPGEVHKTHPHGVPWLRVIDPGMQMTVQDHGRTGFARYGVSPSGAADPDALIVGNTLLSNSPEAAAVEITNGGAQFEALAPSIVAVTGAPCIVRLNQRRIFTDATFALATGDMLELSAVSAGMRTYLCVGGGIAVPQVMGSRATDLRARLGGVDGRSLRQSDALMRRPLSANVAGRVLPHALLRRFPISGKWTLRVLPGPHASSASDTLGALLDATFTVDPHSDRVGVRLRRLDGRCLEGAQVVSEGLPRGAVQVPPDGEPVLLLADAQTTGGYRVPAVVISDDLWQIGQLRHGDLVTFRLVSPGDALEALRRRANEIAELARQPSPARLLDGFAEWGDDADQMISSRKGSDDDE